MAYKRSAMVARIAIALVFAALAGAVFMILPASACTVNDECPSLHACINGSCISVACRSHWDCGTDGYTGDDYCLDSHTVAQKYKEYQCDDTTYTCKYTLTPKTQDTCDGGKSCSDGTCVFEYLRLKIWADEEDVPFNDFVRIRGQVYTDEDTTPARRVTVRVSSDFDAHEWQTLTNEDGEFSLAFLPPVGEHEFEAYAESAGVTSDTASVDVEVYEESGLKGGMDLSASVTPRTVKRGGIITVSGKTTYQTIPIDAEIEILAGNAVYTTTTGAFGEFSKEIVVRDTNVSRIRIDAYASTSGIDVNTQQLHSWENITVVVSQTQKAIESLKLTVPESVKPGETFEAYGTWTIDGTEVDGVDLVMKFAGETIIVPASGGTFSRLLTAPEGEGCYELSAGSVTRQVCVRTHDAIVEDIALERNSKGPNTVTFTAHYNDDGSSVSGTLIYDIGNSTHGRTKMDNGIVTVEHEFKEGEQTISAYVSDGPRGKYYQEVFQIEGKPEAASTVNQSVNNKTGKITISVGDVAVVTGAKKSGNATPNTAVVPVFISGFNGTRLSLNVSLNDGAGHLLLHEEGVSAVIPEALNFTANGLEAGRAYNFCATATNSTGSVVLNYECTKFTTKSTAPFTLTHVIIGAAIALALLLLL